MYTSLKSTFLICLIPAVLISSCSDPDDVVSSLLFENAPDVLEDLHFTLNRINGWHHDNAFLYGLDMQVYNSGEKTVDNIWINIKDVTPASLLEDYSSLARGIERLSPNQSLRPDRSWYFNIDTVDEVYIGNFYVYVRNTVTFNTEFQVLFDVYFQVDGREYETEIRRSFRTISNHGFLGRMQSDDEPLVLNPSATPGRAMMHDMSAEL